MTPPTGTRLLFRAGLAIFLAGCVTAPSTPTPTPTAPAPTSTPTTTPTRTAERFPTAVFANLGNEPVSDALAAELHEVLVSSANGDGLTAAVISPQGSGM